MKWEKKYTQQNIEHYLMFCKSEEIDPLKTLLGAKKLDELTNWSKNKYTYSYNSNNNTNQNTKQNILDKINNR